MVMIANATGYEIGALAVIHAGQIGHLYSPGKGRARIYPWMPYALDNGAWIAHKNGEAWDPAAWREMLRWAALSGYPPLWVLVPDVVGDRAATLERWAEFSPEVRAYGFRLAFAAQNGMTFDDVPADASMIFIGGDDAWKDAAIVPWCAAFPGRVHVARVNGAERLLVAHHAGAVSVDGTGWFHTENSKAGGQKAFLLKYLRETKTRSHRCDCPADTRSKPPTN